MTPVYFNENKKCLQIIITKCNYFVISECKAESLSSVQEKFGIVVDFHGTTEYTDSFQLPEKKKLFPYIINPTPNYNVDGRLMSKRLVEPLRTSYTINYQWPDASQLHLYPWLRQ